MVLSRLKELLPVPENPRGGSGDWLEVESILGASLPEDYKQFIECYGSVYISEFLGVMNPFSENEFVNLLRQQEPHRDAHDALRKGGEKIPYDFFPVPGGLIIVGLTDNGDMIFWKTGPGKWTIVANEARGPDWFSFDGGIVEFLEGLLSGDVDCTLFPMEAFQLRQATPMK